MNCRLEILLPGASQISDTASILFLNMDEMDFFFICIAVNYCILGMGAVLPSFVSPNVETSQCDKLAVKFSYRTKDQSGEWTEFNSYKNINKEDERVLK